MNLMQEKQLLNEPSAKGRGKRKLEIPNYLFWLLIVLYSFIYDRWQDQITPLRVLKIPGFLTLFFAAWWIFKGDKSIIKKNPLVFRYLLFLSAIALSAIYAVNTTSVVNLSRDLFLLLLSCVLPLIAIVNDWKRLRLFFRCWVIIQSILAMITIKNGGTGSGDFLFDENDLGQALCVALPYCQFLLFSKEETGRWKLFYALTIVLIIVGIVMTGSRGTFLGFVGVFGAACFFSRRPTRNLFIGFVVAIIVGATATLFLPAKYIARIDSISDPNGGTRVERLRSWEDARIMWADNPIFGVGAGQFKWRVRQYERLSSYWISDEFTKSLDGREAHSLYFSLLADLGIVGVVLYSALVFKMYQSLRLIVRAEKALQHPAAQQALKRQDQSSIDSQRIFEASLLARAIICSMAAYFVTGTFISVLYYPHLWLMVGFTVILGNVAGIVPGAENRDKKHVGAHI